MLRVITGQAYGYYDDKFPRTQPEAPPELRKNFDEQDQRTETGLKIIFTLRSIAAVLVYSFSVALAISATRRRTWYSSLFAGGVLLAQTALMIYAIQTRNG